MPPASEADRRYGPFLDEFLSSQGPSSPQVPTPSRNEIRPAIYSLSDPRSVSYVAFETILAMGRTPACNHLQFLASDASIFPSCIRLLRHYCHVERRGLFDRAYGLLCFQTVVLSVQVAVLLQTEKLESFLAEMINKPQCSPIFSFLDERVIQAILEGGFGPRRRGPTWLLGWYDDEIAGRSWASCLRQVGGFTINDTKFLAEQIWSARANFLSVAMVARECFSGWGGFMHIMWRILDLNYGQQRVGEHAHTSDQKQCWAHFADIGYRYALCCSEAEDELMPSFLAKCPPYLNPYGVKGPVSALGALDSSHIVQAFLKKLRSRPKLHISFSSMLFSYTCTNISHFDTRNSTSQALQVILERSWVEVTRTQELKREGYYDLMHHVANLLSNVADLHAADPEQTQYLVDLTSNDIFVEFLGRLILSVLFIPEETLPEYIEHTSNIQSDLAQKLIKFGKNIKSFSLHTNLGLGHFLAWFKIAQHLNYCLLMLDTSQFLVQRHLYPWQKCWSIFGSSLALEERFHPTVQCGYPRCAAPNLVLLWECSSCKSEWYCSQRCQRVYVPEFDLIVDHLCSLVNS